MWQRSGMIHYAGKVAEIDPAAASRSACEYPLR